MGGLVYAVALNPLDLAHLVHNGCDNQASFKQGLPCRKANDKKAKLPKFEQSVFKFFKLSSLNDRALYGKPVRGGTNS